MVDRGLEIIILAEPRGYCAGVVRADDSVWVAYEKFGLPLTVFNDIVNNRFVVQKFKDLGVQFVKDINLVPEGERVIFSAHGVSPEVRADAAKRNLQTIDATCGLVSKVHREAIRRDREGYELVLIGHKGHPEAVGTLGQVEGMQLIGSVNDIAKLSFNGDKYAYLTQTTMSVDDVTKIADALSNRYPGIVGPPSDDICFATQNRQNAVIAMAPKCNLILGLGSIESSNSTRLIEIARREGVTSYLVDSHLSVKPEWFDGVRTLGVTSGASVPEYLVTGMVDYAVKTHGNGNVRIETRKVADENVTFSLPKELIG
jgi:4-hydroxy-3-methylbut-2-en-1-yl diphosphate reductase